MRLLLVEDDDTIGEPLSAGLGREGFSVVRARTGGEALDLAADADLVLLDLGLPDVDGLEVCRRLRDRLDIPIIVVTARSDEIDRVLLLEMGADDYVVKPFGYRELVARIRAVSRRTDRGSEAPTTLTVGMLVVDLRRHDVQIDGRSIELTPKEFDLLALHYATDPGTVLSRQSILERVWDAHWYGPTRTLDVHVASLRRKLGDPDWIRTVRGVGFSLEDPDTGPGPST